MEPQKKYEFTGETKTVGGTLLHRIRAARDFTLANGVEVRSGDEGGWIEKEANLSHEGSAWVYDDACVYGDAYVYGNAWVHGAALVYGIAEVYGNAEVYDNAQAYGNAAVYGNAKVYGDAAVYGNAWVSGDAWVSGTARVSGDAEVSGTARVCDNARVYGNAKVKSRSDIIWFKNNWSSGRTVTYTRSNGMWKAGCFYGTGEELITKAYADSETSGECYEAIVRATEAIYNSLAKRSIRKEEPSVQK